MNSRLNISDEEILLPELCRLEFSDEQVKKAGALTNTVTDWKYFSHLANMHGVAALIYHNLEKLKFLSYLPEETVAFLRGALMKSLSRNSFNSESLREVLMLLNNENIRIVLLKGMALEFSDYGNKGLRQMSDVDILIRNDQCLNAWKLLLKNGFDSLPVKSALHKYIIANLGKHLPSLIKNGTSVEIHHELFGDPGKDLTRLLYENSYEIDLKGKKAFIPQPQIFFLYLVRHLNLHERNNESQLRLYTDLVVLIEKHREEIITPYLLEYAKQAEMCEILAEKLWLLTEIWKISFPPFINDFIDKWNDPGSLNKFVFFLKSPKGNPPIDKVENYRRTISEIPGSHRKFLYISGDIFPTIRFMKERYKCSSTLKVFIYYPHRFGKLLYLLKK